jgi:hypothetical protein
MTIAGKCVRLVVVSAVAVVCAFQAGCLQLPYAYPNVMHVSAVQLAPGPDQVHAFRVEVNGKVADLGEKTEEFVLSRVAVENKTRVPSQTNATLEYGVYVADGGVNYPIHTNSALLVRLYRPGYELVELRAGVAAAVEWKPVQNPLAQEKAIDDLLNVPALSYRPTVNREGRDVQRSIQQWNPAHLPPGSRFAPHQDALLFAASEYERLAAAGGSEESVSRLRKKAAAIRARAAE